MDFALTRRVRVSVPRSQSDRADALLTPARALELDTQGWTVIDDVFPQRELAAILQQASQLRKTMQVRLVAAFAFPLMYPVRSTVASVGGVACACVVWTSDEHAHRSARAPRARELRAAFRKRAGQASASASFAFVCSLRGGEGAEGLSCRRRCRRT